MEADMGVRLLRCARLLGLGLLTLPTLTASASYRMGKFEDRVCGTEAIAFGEVTDIEKRTMSVTFYGAHGYTTWYDWASLKDARVLKGGQNVASTYGNETTVHANPLPASAETEKKIADALRGCKAPR